ncbi:hypothetical protein N9J72_00595 [Candidatus Gracilibacteria bacterium]|nr:hypothetical protein [Candidatus Gracilibacteria bacterium]
MTEIYRGLETSEEIKRGGDISEGIQNTARDKLENLEFNELLGMFEKFQNEETNINMNTTERDNAPIFSSSGKNITFQEAQIQISYPTQIKQALIDLYKEYNLYFGKVITECTQGQTQYPSIGDYKTTSNFVQIDMMGIPKGFLDFVQENNIPIALVKEVLRKKIFEIENSVAAYSLLSHIGTPEGNSVFNQGLKAGIKSINSSTGKNVILLCLSQEKYESVMRFDIGIQNIDNYERKDITSSTGFYDVYSPADLQRSIEENEDILFYTRSSLDIGDLKKPNGTIANTLLGEKDVFEYVRSRSITHNIDNPNGSSENTTNDTKKYMPQMGIGYPVSSIEEIYTEEYLNYLSGKRKNDFFGKIYTNNFGAFLQGYGYNNDDIRGGKIEIHAKPQDLAYGVYGHIIGDFSDGKKRKMFKQGLETRGDYIIQPRMKQSLYTDSQTEISYIYIDRVFLYFDYESGEIESMGGFRNHMPKESNDGKKGVVHGGPQTVYSNITL